MTTPHALALEYGQLTLQLRRDPGAAHCPRLRAIEQQLGKSRAELLQMAFHAILP